MAQLYCTGPAHIYAAPPGALGALSYLGTCEDAPVIRINAEFEPVRNDIGGKRKPFDMQYQGEDALISIDLNRYNESVYSLLAARPAGASPRGSDVLTDIGTLVMTEGAQSAIVVQFPFVAKASMVAGGMPPGYYFPTCVTIAPEELRQGTRPKKVNMVFYAWSQWSPVTQGFLLYSNVLPALPTIN